VIGFQKEKHGPLNDGCRFTARVFFIGIFKPGLFGVAQTRYFSDSVSSSEEKRISGRIGRRGGVDGGGETGSSVSEQKDVGGRVLDVIAGKRRQ